MIYITIDPASLDEIADNIDMVKERLSVGLRLGMRDALHGLAEAEVAATESHHKTGFLERILSRGIKVLETDEEIIGIYRPRSAGKQEAYWLEFGTHVPAVDALMNIHAHGEEFVRSSHRAFDVAAQPYFFETAESFRDQFLAILQARVQEALTA